MTKHIRYRYTTKPLSRKEACERKRQDIAHAKARLIEVEKEFRRACRQPLETEIEVQEEVRPGEPGFDELPDRLVPQNYQGNVKWINIPR